MSYSKSKRKNTKADPRRSGVARTNFVVDKKSKLYFLMPELLTPSPHSQTGLLLVFGKFLVDP